jgi:hypothetical protein
MNASEESPKVAKKLAKAAAKAAKKQTQVEPAGPPPAADAHSPKAGPSPAERAAAAAERQVALQRWRVLLAVVMVIIALGSLLVMMWLRG